MINYLVGPVEVVPDPVDGHPHHVVESGGHEVFNLAHVQLLPEDLVLLRVGQVEEALLGVVVDGGRAGDLHHGHDHVELRGW